MSSCFLHNCVIIDPWNKANNSYIAQGKSFPLLLSYMCSITYDFFVLYYEVNSLSPAHYIFSKGLGAYLKLR